MPIIYHYHYSTLSSIIVRVRKVRLLSRAEFLNSQPQLFLHGTEAGAVLFSVFILIGKRHSKFCQARSHLGQEHCSKCNLPNPMAGKEHKLDGAVANASVASSSCMGKNSHLENIPHVTYHPSSNSIATTVLRLRFLNSAYLVLLSYPWS